MTRLAWTAAFLSTCLIASQFAPRATAQTAESTAEPTAEAAPAKSTSESTADLIRQLDADKFGERQAASQKLAEAGRSAIAPLAEVARTGSREAGGRAVEILKKHLQSKDEATRQEARAALEKLAALDDARVAGAAKNALQPAEQAAPGAVPGLPPGIQINGGQIQIQVQAIAGGVAGRKMQMQNVNGVKTIKVEENGRKVQIVDDPQNGIKMEVTEKVDGKEQTKKYEAKDADDLQKKHPDAHKIYEASTKPAAVQIQINGGAIPVMPALPVPGAPIPAPFRVPAIDAEQTKRLERVRKDLEGVEQRLKKTAENSPQADEIGKSIAELEAARKQLDEALEKLRSP